MVPSRDTCTVVLLLENCLLLWGLGAGSPCYRMLSALTVLSQGTIDCQLAASPSHILPDGCHKHVLP